MTLRDLPLDAVALVLLVLAAPVLAADRLTDALSGFETAPAAVAADGAEGVVYHRSFLVRDGEAVDVAVGAGSVRVETTSASEATVVVTGTGRGAQAAFERLGFRADVRDGRLVVRTRPQSWVGPADARFVYTIRVPRRLDVAVGTGTGDVAVRHAVGQAG